jgi:diacylglycerol O-acyltransferase
MFSLSLFYIGKLGATMKHLSALDALFLQLETPETPMHVGSLMMLGAFGARKDPYKVIRAHIEKRLHLAPVFSRVVRFMPLDLASPLWIDAPRMDLDYHIRHLTLPKPGTQAQLENAVAKLHEGALDRDRPFWQFTVIDGLKSGEVGFYAKIHHAALDGQGGIAVAQALLDTQKKPRATPAPQAAAARLPPSASRMLASALRNTVAQYGRILKAVPGVAKAAGRAGAVTLSSGDLKKRGIALAPRNRLNSAICGERLFVAMQIPLAEVKAIARAFDGKLNDAVLAICAGALRKLFAGESGALARAMVGAVPLSLRAPGDTTQENQVSMMLVSLATHIADPVKRMEAIRSAATRAKMLAGSVKGAIPTDLPSLGIPWLMAAITPLYRKAVAAPRIPVIANVVISNVPGPQATLYLAGAELKAYYPGSIVTHGLALNVTIVSYDGSLDFGLVACKRTVPDLRSFAKHLTSAHKELLKAARKTGRMEKR